MSFNNKLAVALLATAAILTAAHSVRIPYEVNDGTTTSVQLVQVFQMPEMVLGALWVTGFGAVVIFYFRKAPSKETTDAMQGS